MKIKIILLIITLATSIFAQNDEIKATGFTFLRLNYSARASAMANAFTGLSNDANAVFFNPAGLTQIETDEASLTYMNYFMGINCGSAVYAHKMKDATVAFFVKGLNATEDRTLENESGTFDGYDGTFGVSMIELGTSLGKQILHNLDVGISAKYLLENLDDKSASAIVFDFAVLHQTTNKHLKLGIVLRNFGKQMSYHNEYEEGLPRTISAGFSFHPSEKFYTTIDINKPLEDDIFGSIGTEFQIYPILAMRMGYKTNAKDWQTGGDLDVFAGISCGLGFDLHHYNMEIDYAISSYGDLGVVNQITLKYNF
ncbi:MAG: PorV/PorQ family protein [Candidatus Cloacimonetes bacterium]|jgi:hypothetical protein|nr:PorV/PorQ family protein [Candidatus Cloacimonadota bacterium]MBT6994155.1 PorV/PorQ family protein [Candidatus Cloacimonadota bacterium]MBT7469369.1 PorV/PorQ family protein [Candidatus Cloacimonadota bacterium]